MRLADLSVFGSRVTGVAGLQAGLLWEPEAPSGPSPSAASVPAGVMRSNAADSATAFSSPLCPNCCAEN